MRLRTILFFAAILPLLTSCSSTPNGTEKFYDRHPQYDQRPSYFDKDPGYDNQDLNDRYSR